MQSSAQLPLSTELDVDALVQREADQVQRLLNGRLLLGHPPLTAKAEGALSVLRAEGRSGRVGPQALLLLLLLCGRLSGNSGGAARGTR